MALMKHTGCIATGTCQRQYWSGGVADLRSENIETMALINTAMSTGTSERKRIHAIKTLRSDFVALLILHDERRDHSDKRNETNPGGQIVDEISSSGQKTMSYVYDPSGGLMA